jgi:hypothetical protein
LHEKQSPKFFSVPIPPVDLATIQAVQQQWAPESRVQRKLREQANQVLETIRQLQHDQKTQGKRIKIHSDKLAKVLVRKEMALEEIRLEKEQELESSRKDVENRVRKQEEEKFKKQQDDMKQEIQDNFEKDFEAKQAARKRKMEEESTDKEVEDRRQKLEPESNKTLESERIKVKVDELQANLDQLQEKKSEMVWLLKQVIKADAKRKVELLKQKKAAASSES